MPLKAENTSETAPPTVQAQELGAAFELPVIRLIPLFRKTRLIAIYADHLIEGYIASRQVTLSEEMCHPDGETKLKRQLTRYREIQFCEITDIGEIPNLQLSKVTIRCVTGQPFVFWLNSSQLPSVRQALLASLGDRYWIWRRATDGSLAWSLARDEMGGSKPPLPKRAGHTALRPKYAPIRGRVLKLAGVIYWILLLSPLTDPLAERFSGGASTYLWFILWLPVPWLISRGSALCQLAYEPALYGDVRAPILFLRPFNDDGVVSFQPPGLFAALTGVRGHFNPNQWNSIRDDSRLTPSDLLLSTHPVRLLRMLFNRGASSAEESVVRFLRTLGPVIAIGRPDETVQTLGSARIYADDNWKDLIRKQLPKCQAVVLQAGTTLGIAWEIEQIRQLMEPDRVLLSLPSFWRNPQAYEDLCALLERIFHRQFPRSIPFTQRPAFILFDSNWTPLIQEVSLRCPLVWPLTADATDIRHSLGSFVERLRRGTPLGPPRRLHWSGGLGTLLTKFTALIVALTVILIPVYTVKVGSAVVLVGFQLTKMLGQLAAQPPEEKVLAAVRSADNMTLRGAKAPYEFSVPANFIKVDLPGTEKVDHVRMSPDGKLTILVFAEPGPLNLANFPRECLALQQRITTTSANIESVRSIRQAGIDWTEVRVASSQSVNTNYIGIHRVTNGANWSVYVLSSLVKSPRSDPTYERVLDKLWESFRFSDRPVGQ